MNLVKSLALTIGAVFFLFVQYSFAISYDHSLKVEDMEFHWKVEGSHLAVKAIAKTTGWVSVGFNPVEEMQGANYIIGFVKNGKLEISDDFGHRTTSHTPDERRGGKNSIVSSSGSEEGSNTTIEFKIPLDSGDKTDTVIDPNGKTIVLLGHGGRDSFRTGHDYYAIIEVNLNSGVFKVTRQSY